MILKPEVFNYISSISKPKKTMESLIDDAKRDKVPIISNEVADFLRLMISLGRYENILELGCGYGHSTLTLAEAKKTFSNLVSVDSSVNSVDYVRKLISDRGDIYNVKVVHSDALTFLNNNCDSFDMFFVDAVKSEYGDYFDLIMRIAKKGSLIVFDNVLWKGRVTNLKPEGKASFLLSFNKKFIEDQRLISTILSVGDGLAVGVVC